MKAETDAELDALLSGDFLAKKQEAIKEEELDRNGDVKGEEVDVKKECDEDDVPVKKQEDNSDLGQDLGGIQKEEDVKKEGEKGDIPIMPVFKKRKPKGIRQK